MTAQPTSTIPAATKTTSVVDNGPMRLDFTEDKNLILFVPPRI
jgi:hypothetical protein